MAKKNEIQKSELYEMVKKELFTFVKKQKLQEERAKIQAELEQLDEVRAGAEMNKDQDYHDGQRKPEFDVKGTHLTEEGEGDITSPDQVKSDADLDKYIQNLISQSGSSLEEGGGEEEMASGDDVQSSHGSDWSGLGEAEISEGLENAIHWDGEVAKLYDHPVAKMEDGEVVFTDPDGEKALSKHVGVLKAKYEKAKSMVAEEGVAEEGIEEYSPSAAVKSKEAQAAMDANDGKLPDDMLPDWLKEEMEEDDMEETYEEAEDMGMYEMEEVVDETIEETVEEEELEEVVEEGEVEEEVDMEKIQEGLEAKVGEESAEEIVETVKEELNENAQPEQKSLISESEQARLQRLAGI